MISIETIGKKLSQIINRNLYGYEFKVFTDTGKYQKAEREYNQVKEVINCLLTAGLPELTNLTDGNIIATQNYRLELLLRLENFEESIEDEGVELPGQEDAIRKIFDGNIERISKVRDILSGVSQQNYQELMTDSEGKTFAVTTVYQFLQSGNRDQRPGVGNSFTFSMNIYAMFIENGVNTQDVKYYLDGNIIPFQAITSLQAPTLDGNVYANTTNGRTKVLASQTSLSFSFELPALDNEVTRTITDFIFKPKLNLAHVLTVEKTNEETKAYFVTLGETRQTGETIKNIGQSLTLLETVNEYELVEIPAKYYVYYLTPTKTTISVVGFAYFIEEDKFTSGGAFMVEPTFAPCYVITLEEQTDSDFTLERGAENG